MVQKAIWLRACDVVVFRPLVEIASIPFRDRQVPSGEEDGSSYLERLGG